jgi:hypothetical protein
VFVPRKNRYDPDEVEYWRDYRTEGERGTLEQDGINETMSGNTAGFSSNELDLQRPMSKGLDMPAGVEEEGGMKAPTLKSM